MSKAFNQGDTVFSIHGEEAVYLAKSAHGHVVQPVFEDDEQEPYYGQAVTWPEVFAKPPVARLHSDIAQLEQKAEALRQEIRSMADVKRMEQEQLGAIQQRYKAHPQLADLDLWLSGDCTHLVIIDSYSFEVKELNEALTERDRGDTWLRLLSLVVDPKKKHEYQLHMSRYYDGSGNQRRVILATSLEDATAKAKEWFMGELQRNGRGSGREHYSLGLASCALQYGFPVPDDLMQKLAEGNAKAKADRLAQARRTYESAKLALESLEQAATES